MPTLIQNLETGPTVFSDPKDNIALEWQGHGDPNGGDVQYVPDSLVTENVSFLKALNRGIFAVVEADEEVQAKLNAQAQSYADRRAAGKASLESVIERDQDKTLANVSIDEKGRVANVDSQDKPVTSQKRTPGTVIVESENRDSEGRPIDTELSVVLGPRERG